MWRVTTLLVSTPSVTTSDDHGGIGGGGEVTGSENITNLDQVVDTSPVQVGTHGNVSHCKSVGHVGVVIAASDTGIVGALALQRRPMVGAVARGQCVRWGS